MIQSVTQSCIICRRNSAKPQPPQIGQLPVERVTPDGVFDRVGLDYAGPVLVKYCYIRSPVVIKSCICISVAALHTCRLV